MATARQKAEWSRFADLMNMLHNRLQFGKDAEMTEALDWMPPQLVTKAERRAVQEAARRAKQARVTSVPFSVVAGVITNGRNGK